MRNLSLAYYNKQHNPQKALATLEKAYNLDTTDARILMELDQLYKKLRYPHRQRLDFLEAHADVVEQRDDLCIERITLYNQLGEYQKAYDLINSRKFIRGREVKEKSPVSIYSAVWNWLRLPSVRGVLPMRSAC